jgi:hypothetical protein
MTGKRKMTSAAVTKGWKKLNEQQEALIAMERKFSECTLAMHVRMF